MVAPACSDEEFVALFQQHGPTGVAKIHGINVRNVHARRRAIEGRRGIVLTSPSAHAPPTVHEESNFPHRVHLDITDGCVLIGSDCHYWPGIVTTAHRAFVKFCREMEPRAVILNGDVLDGARISRFPPTGRQHQPALIDELEACKDRTHEIEMASTKSHRIWTLGNHDARFENKLADLAPEYADIEGFRLKDHFPHWEPAWAVWINDTVVIKHRWKGGIHAPRNNTLHSGKTMVTGHLHSLKVHPYTDYSGTRYGVDCGTMAEPFGPQFVDYTEDSPVDWRSGFCVLTFVGGKLLTPEVVQRHDADRVEFRGRLVEV